MLTYVSFSIFCDYFWFNEGKGKKNKKINEGKIILDEFKQYIFIYCAKAQEKAQ